MYFDYFFDEAIQCSCHDRGRTYLNADDAIGQASRLVVASNF